MKRKKLNSLQWQCKQCHEKVLIEFFHGPTRIFSAVDAFHGSYLDRSLM